jgi:hypothetical protein
VTQSIDNLLTVTSANSTSYNTGPPLVLRLR